MMGKKSMLKSVVVCAVLAVALVLLSGVAQIWAEQATGIYQVKVDWRKATTDSAEIYTTTQGSGAAVEDTTQTLRLWRSVKKGAGTTADAREYLDKLSIVYLQELKIAPGGTSDSLYVVTGMDVSADGTNWVSHASMDSALSTANNTKAANLTLTNVPKLKYYRLIMRTAATHDDTCYVSEAYIFEGYDEDD